MNKKGRCVPAVRMPAPAEGTLMGETRVDFRSERDGAAIAAYRWAPRSAPRAVVQISHGLAEHALRYRRLAAALNDAEIAAYANDHRGHGGSIQEGAAPGDFGAAGWNGVVGDMAQFARAIRKDNPGVPLVLLGHSMGSFAVQTFLLDHSAEIDGCALSGSSDLPTIAGAAASGADMSFAALNSAFEPARTPFDWLSRDAAEVDAYIADPLCGFDAPAETSTAMLGAAARIGDAAEMARIRKDLPILIFSGDKDPVGFGGALVAMLAQRFRDANIVDVRLKLYPAARHEIFNETNRDEATADLIAWIEDAVL